MSQVFFSAEPSDVGVIRFEAAEKIAVAQQQVQNPTGVARIILAPEGTKVLR
jgi:hypothetical protein